MRRASSTCYLWNCKQTLPTASSFVKLKLFNSGWEQRTSAGGPRLFVPGAAKASLPLCSFPAGLGRRVLEANAPPLAPRPSSWAAPARQLPRGAAREVRSVNEAGSPLPRGPSKRWCYTSVGSLRGLVAPRPQGHRTYYCVFALKISVSSKMTGKGTPAAPPRDGCPERCGASEPLERRHQLYMGGRNCRVFHVTNILGRAKSGERLKKNDVRTKNMQLRVSSSRGGFCLYLAKIQNLNEVAMNIQFFLLTAKCTCCRVLASLLNKSSEHSCACLHSFLNQTSLLESNT